VNRDDSCNLFEIQSAEAFGPVEMKILPAPYSFSSYIYPTFLEIFYSDPDSDLRQQPRAKVLAPRQHPRGLRMPPSMHCHHGLNNNDHGPGHHAGNRACHT
jgi:hypothetical protein